MWLCLPCNDYWSKAVLKHGVLSCWNMQLFMPTVALQSGNWAYSPPCSRGFSRFLSWRAVDPAASLCPCDPDEGQFLYLGSKTNGILWLDTRSCVWAAEAFMILLVMHATIFPVLHPLLKLSKLLGKTIVYCECDW